LAVSQNIHKAVFCDPSHIPCRAGTVTLLQHRSEAGSKGERHKDVEIETRLCSAHRRNTKEI
jgi:hypothetical protein